MNTLAVPTPISRAESSAKIVSTTTGDFGALARLTRMGKTLAQVMAYENPDVVARIAKEEKMSLEESASIFRDVLLFLWLGHNIKGSLAPTPRIDLGWHVFLLFTKDYREFCVEFFGGFIDHHPRRLTDEPDGGRVVAKSRAHSQEILAGELGLVLSRNWIYTKLELAVGDGCACDDAGCCQNAQAKAAKATANCCGNCGSDCCSR